MQIDFSTLSAGAIYHAMTQTLLPRPIAWVLSENENQSYNLAPISFFNGVSSEPPLLFLSVGSKSDGTKKDTWRNIEERHRFVVHIPHRELAAAVTESSRELPFGESEVTALRLELTQDEGAPMPRLAEARIALFCRLDEIKRIDSPAQALIFGRIESLYLSESVASFDENGRLRVDARAVDPLARLGANQYLAGGEVMEGLQPKPT